MRLNFSGSDEGEIREGIRRVGKVIEEQVALFGTLTGKPAAEAASPEPADADTPRARVLPLPRRREDGRRAGGQ